MLCAAQMKTNPTPDLCPSRRHMLVLCHWDQKLGWLRLVEKLNESNPVPSRAVWPCRPGCVSWGHCLHHLQIWIQANSLTYSPVEK